MFSIADLDKMLQTACIAARQAGQLAKSGMDDANASMKAGQEIVTQYDSLCQQLIIEILSKDYGNCGYIGEEGDKGNIFKISPKANDNLWWVIDPIDGTRNYASGLPYFAVSIGCLLDGKPILGVIYDPCTDTIFQGHYKNKPRCNGREFDFEDKNLDNNSQIAISSKSFENYPKLIQTIHRNFVPINIGSAALHFAYVARGAYAGAMAHKVKLWDIAGAAGMASNLDLVIKHPDGANVFPFDCENYQGQVVPVMFSGRKLADFFTANL